MSSCKLVIKDEVNVKFENLDLKWRQKLANKFKYQVPYAYHLPAVKLGRWDGKISFFGLGGTTYLNLVEQILPILEAGGVYVELEDRRIKAKGGMVCGVIRKKKDKGGIALVPNAPAEPDQRIDKMTGVPYDEQAGEAYTDVEDRQGLIAAVLGKKLQGQASV